jgi:hypothetical protein
MSDFDNYIMDHYESQEENMVEENKPRLTLEEGQALLKVLLNDVKYGPIGLVKAKLKMEEITKNIQYPVSDEKRPINEKA